MELKLKEKMSSLDVINIFPSEQRIEKSRLDDTINPLKEMAVIVAFLLDNDKTLKENMELVYKTEPVELDRLTTEASILIEENEKKKTLSKTKYGNTKNT